MSKRLAEDLCAAWTSRTGIATIVLRAVMILADESLDCVTREEVELGAFVHVNDVGAATVLALAADLHGHVRLTLCGPGEFDTTAAASKLGIRTVTTKNDHRVFICTSQHEAPE